MPHHEIVQMPGRAIAIILAWHDGDPTEWNRACASSINSHRETYPFSHYADKNLVCLEREYAFWSGLETIFLLYSILRSRDISFCPRVGYF